jgi:hypothetical protein
MGSGRASSQDEPVRQPIALNTPTYFELRNLASFPATNLVSLGRYRTISGLVTRGFSTLHRISLFPNHGFFGGRSPTSARELGCDSALSVGELGHGPARREA